MRKLVTMLGLFICGSVHAEGYKFGFDYDFSFTRDDHNLTKTDAHDPTATVNTGQTGYLSFSGSKGKASFDVYYDVTSSKAEVAMGTLKCSDSVTITAGRNYLNSGGFENKNANFATIVLSPYNDGAGNQLLGPATQFSVGMGVGAGTVTLQLTDDVESGEMKQPATLLEYTGTFGNITPLIQIVPYDKGRSMQTALGIGFSNDQLTAYLDYVMDSREVAGSSDKDTYTNIALDLVYNMGAFAPFLKVSSFDVTQGGVDKKGNADSSTFDDNANIIMVGANINQLSEHMAPYIAVISKSAKVIEGSEEESKSGTKLVVGVGGSF